MLKIFLVSIILAIGLFLYLVSLDMIMGTTLKGIVWKEINPFRVMETAEYIILILFILFFLFHSLGSYLKKKRQNKQPSN